MMEPSTGLIHHHLHRMVLLLFMLLHGLLLIVVNLGRIILHLMAMTSHILRFNLEFLFICLPVGGSDLPMFLSKVGSSRHLLTN